MTEKIGIYSKAKPKKRVNIGKGDIMHKELLSPLECFKNETRDSEIPKVDNNEVYFAIVDQQSFD